MISGARPGDGGTFAARRSLPIGKRFQGLVVGPGFYAGNDAVNISNGLDVADDSKATDVGARYAQALFELAVDSQALEAIEADLAALKALMVESRDLRTLLASPRFSSEDKAKGLEAIARRAHMHATTIKFLGLLAQNRRTGALGAILAAFDALAAAHRGFVAAEVVTAVPLTPAQSRGLTAALRQALGQDPQISARVDPAILGGLRGKVGSRLYDASLKSKLDSLKFALKRA